MQAPAQPYTYGPFSDEEGARICHHLGYPSISRMEASIQLGIPAASEPLFILLINMNRLTAGGVLNVRKDLCQCEAIEDQMASARGRMKVSGVEGVKMNADETGQLRRELTYWQRKLADDLAVVYNPYSQIAWLGDGGGVNSRVIG